MLELRKRMRKLIIFTTILLGLGLFCFTYLSAQIVDKEYTRTYLVQDDYIEVSESKTIKVNQPTWFIEQGGEEVFTIFNPVQNDPKREEKLQQTKESISVRDSRGVKLDYSTEITESGNIILKVKFPIRITFPNQYTIYLNYNSYGLITKSGKLRDVYVPSFASDYKFITENVSESVITRVLVPKSFGAINFATPVNSTSEEGNNYIVTFTQESLRGETGWIQIGTEQIYNFKITQPISMTSNADFFLNKYKVLVPRDLESGPVKQKVHFTNISPTPSNSSRDSDGNLFFEFSFPSNQNGEIVIEGYAVLSQDNNIDYKNSGKLSQIPEEILKANTSAAKYWESDDKEIQKVANELKSQVAGEDKNVYELINNTYKFVVDRIDYSEVKRFGINERQGALATLQGGAAVCMEYSDLFIALMRAQGVPARGAFGYGYSALDSETTGTTSHQWAEVYIPTLGGWISVDTTWGESGHELIGGDLNHFYTHVASISPDIPATTEAQFYGNLAQVPSKIVSVQAIDSTPTGEGQTGDELYTQYHQDETSSGLSDLIERVKLAAFEINSSIDDFIYSLIPQASPIIVTGIKLLPLFIVAIGLATIITKKVKSRKKSFEF